MNISGNSITSGMVNPQYLGSGSRSSITFLNGLGEWATPTASIADGSITYAKIQDVSATNKLLGRSTAGAGVVEEIDCSAAGRAILDDADASAQRTTLGLGTLATQSGTFSGTSSGTNTGDQTITLTGDVTGSGTGSFAATIASGAVSSSKATAELLCGCQLKTSGDYPAGSAGIQAGTNGKITLDRLFAIPFFVGKSQSFKRISVNALGTASSFIRLGLYADDGSGKPGSLIADYGQVATSGSGEASITISPAVTLSGRVWVAAVGQGVAPSTTRLGTAVVNRDVHPSNHYSVSFTAIAFSQNSVSGSLPSSWGSTYNIEATANTVPLVWLRAN